MQITIWKWDAKSEEESNHNLVAIILLVLLFPIRNQLKDGGTVEYKALVYKVSKVKKTNFKRGNGTRRKNKGIRLWN